MLAVHERELNNRVAALEALILQWHEDHEGMARTTSEEMLHARDRKIKDSRKLRGRE